MSQPYERSPRGLGPAQPHANERQRSTTATPAAEQVPMSPIACEGSTRRQNERKGSGVLPIGTASVLLELHLRIGRLPVVHALLRQVCSGVVVRVDSQAVELLGI